MDLNEIMSFDHVIAVKDGAVVPMPSMLYAPNLYWSEGGYDLQSDQWTLMAGYSGQDRYTGPIMHECESIGGRLERDILGNEGIYVALVCEDMDDPDHPAGWAVARLTS